MDESVRDRTALVQKRKAMVLKDNSGQTPH